ncbi:DUF4235 domain-containing protein [Luteolibacter marinus]|uniref:DUF4235 domain-containing protein n=1 Tax=Luteolibacter marinus TaxID=2776705 RepID=UPI001867C098|nr:DUF4235 domain-containing protein [Luteolibacter marinus]
MNTSPKALGLIAAGFIAPAIAARLSRSVAGAGYHAITHVEPPKNPAHPRVGWQEAIVWTVFSGAVGGLARLAVRRWMAGTIIPAEGYDLEERVQERLEG